MTKVVADISMSLDGFVAGPNAGLDNGLGDGGGPLHAWAIDSDDDLDAAVLKASTDRSGAVVMGRRLFDIIDGPQGWNDDMDLLGRRRLTGVCGQRGTDPGDAASRRKSIAPAIRLRS